MSSLGCKALCIGISFLEVFLEVHLIDFAVLADNRVKIKESKKTVKYLNLAREYKKKL